MQDPFKLVPGYTITNPPPGYTSLAQVSQAPAPQGRVPRFKVVGKPAPAPISTAPGTVVNDLTAARPGAPGVGAAPRTMDPMSLRARLGEMATRHNPSSPPSPDRGWPYSPKAGTPRVGSVVRPAPAGATADTLRAAGSRAGGAARSAAGAARTAAGGAAKAAGKAARATGPGLKALGRAAGRVATAPVGGTLVRALPGIGTGATLYTLGEATGANEALRNTETAQAATAATVEAAADLTGLEDLQNRMMSDDPAIAAAALAEYQAANPQAAEPSPPSPTAAAAPGDGSAAPIATPEPGSPQFLVEEAVNNNRAPADDTLNANRPIRIEGTDYGYVGDYGDNSVVRRDVLNDDGSATAEFTDTDTLAGRRRQPQTAEAIAAEQARVARARADYVDNTTMSDGRRAFGGQEVAALNQARLETVQGERGPALNQNAGNATVERQLLEEGLPPGQLAAYRRDPMKAYEIDAASQAAGAKFNYQYMKDTLAGQRADRKEARQARTDSMKAVDRALKPLIDMGGTQAEAANVLRAQIAAAYEATGGSVPVEELLNATLQQAPRTPEGDIDYEALLSAQGQQSSGLDRYLSQFFSN